MLWQAGLGKRRLVCHTGNDRQDAGPTSNLCPDLGACYAPLQKIAFSRSRAPARERVPEGSDYQELDISVECGKLKQSLDVSAFSRLYS